MDLKPGLNRCFAAASESTETKLVSVQAVCVILDVKPAKAKDEAGKPINDYWKPSVALLNEKDFLNKLKTYDKDNINPKLIDKIRTSYLTNEGFTPENAKKASPAAEGMCKWVHAMSSYEKVRYHAFAYLYRHCFAMYKNTWKVKAVRQIATYCREGH